MAELNIGTQCENMECKQLDFLPIQCSSCKKFFCKLHSHQTSHRCDNISDNLIIHDSSLLVNHHHESCSFDNCNNDEIVRIACPYCNLKFCLNHRHMEIHNCSVKITSEVLTSLQSDAKHHTFKKCFKNKPSTCTDKRSKKCANSI